MINPHAPIWLYGSDVHPVPDEMYCITYPMESRLISYINIGILTPNNRYQGWKPLTVYVGNFDTLDAIHTASKTGREALLNNCGQRAFFSDITPNQLLEFLHQRIVEDGITFLIIYGIHNIAFNKKDVANFMADLDYFLSNLRKLQNEALAQSNPCTIILLCLSHPRYGDDNKWIAAFNPEWPIEINTKNSSNIVKKIFPIGCAKLFEIPKDNPNPTKIFGEL